MLFKVAYTVVPHYVVHHFFIIPADYRREILWPKDVEISHDQIVARRQNAADQYHEARRP